MLSSLCVLGVLCGAPVSVEAAKKRPARAAAAKPAVDAKPDRALYPEAQAELAALKAAPARLARRAEWERVALKFQRVVARYP